MPAKELSRLIERLHPGVAVRRLEEDAGLPTDRIQHWLKPGTAVNRIPPPDAIFDIARALSCTATEVAHAFNDSLPRPLPLRDLPPDEQTLLDRFRQLSTHDRASLLAIAQTLVASSQNTDAAQAQPRRRGSRTA